MNISKTVEERDRKFSTRSARFGMCESNLKLHIKLFSFGNKPVLDSHVGMLTKHLTKCVIFSF